MCCTFVYSVINLIWNKQYVFFIVPFSEGSLVCDFSVETFSYLPLEEPMSPGVNIKLFTSVIYDFFE